MVVEQDVDPCLAENNLFQPRRLDRHRPDTGYMTYLHTSILREYTIIRVEDGVAERTIATSTDAGSKPRLRVAFFIGQVAVSGEKCRHPLPGHGRYLRTPTKKSANPKTHVFNNLRFLPDKQKRNSLPGFTIN